MLTENACLTPLLLSEWEVWKTKILHQRSRGVSLLLIWLVETKQHIFNPTSLIHISDIRSHHPSVNRWTDDGSITPAGLCLFSPTDSCRLTIDTKSVSRKLELSNGNKKVSYVGGHNLHRFHRHGFHSPQLLCINGLTDRHYWEVEWSGDVYIAVSYSGISRKGITGNNEFGSNSQSWALVVKTGSSSVIAKHDNTETPIVSHNRFNRVAVYVDYAAGILSFFSVSSDTLIHFHTFKTRFTDPLYPGFAVFPGSTVILPWV